MNSKLLESNLSDDLQYQRRVYSKIKENLVTAFGQTALAVTLYAATQFLAPASLQQTLDQTPVDEIATGLAVVAIGAKTLSKNRKSLQALRNAKGLILSNHGLDVKWPAGNRQVERAIVRKYKEQARIRAIMQETEKRHQIRWDRFQAEISARSTPAP